MTDSTPRLLRKPDVRARTGLSDTRIDELEACGLFPRRVPISGLRAVGWVESEVTAYIRARIEARDAQPPPDSPKRTKSNRQRSKRHQVLSVVK